MNNELTLGRRSNLVMPTHYVELDEEEMAYVDGGWNWKKFWRYTAAITGLAATAIVTIIDPEPCTKLAAAAKCLYLVSAVATMGGLD